VVSNYWVDHCDYILLIDLRIAFSLSSFQIEVEVLIRQIILHQGFSDRKELQLTF
jgi:hypothetical protein